jgi:hypothetical protein
MPNLLPDWTLTLPGDLGAFTLREAGRLIWSILLTGYGITIVLLLIKPPLLKRPFPNRAGYALFGVILVGGLVLGKLIPDIQRTIVWLTLAALAGHSLLMIASRKPRDPEQKATWSECYVGALGVFALFTLAYAIVPHEWLTFANANLEWGDSSKFVFQSNEEILGFVGINYPFSLDYPAVRDIVVTVIYIVFLGLNLKLWSMWQKRHEVAVPAGEGDETAPARRSRFGRPLRAWSARRAEAGSASATAAPSGSGGA